MLDVGVTTEEYARETFEEANPELFSDEIIAEDAAPADDVSFALSSQSTTAIPREITYDKHGKPEPTIDAESGETERVQEERRAHHSDGVKRRLEKAGLLNQAPAYLMPFISSR